VQKKNIEFLNLFNNTDEPSLIPENVKQVLRLWEKEKDSDFKEVKEV
jgi:hypothetical protein